ncbi:MAG: CDP-alcohol phosphatidyltransferase family protein [Candidatus Magasanikbacteria bacterium]
MTNQTFAGDKKKGRSILSSVEKKIIDKYTPKIPTWIETHHLTYTTIVWSGLIILFSFLAQWNIYWLWGVSIMIFLQWLTDAFDGAVGRYRNTGLIKWGYYMDHFLDYIFLCSILIGYAILLPDNFKYLLFFILVILGAFMVNSFLAFAATNEFKIVHLGIGPTEIRILFIVVNTLIIVFGKTYMAFSLPYALAISFIGLIFIVYDTQKNIWKLDMKNKKTPGS